MILIREKPLRHISWQKTFNLQIEHNRAVPLSSLVFYHTQVSREMSSMNRRKSLVLILFCVGIMISTLFICRYKINNRLLIWIDNRLDYERALDVGDEFNKVAWGDLTFQINYYKSGNKLDYVRKNAKIHLLDSVLNYKISEGILYIVSNDGYAIVNQNNIAKIYVTSNNKYVFNNVIYLDSFDDFEYNEQAVLNKLDIW